MAALMVKLEHEGVVVRVVAAGTRTPCSLQHLSDGLVHALRTLARLASPLYSTVWRATTSLATRTSTSITSSHDAFPTSPSAT